MELISTVTTILIIGIILLVIAVLFSFLFAKRDDSVKPGNGSQQKDLTGYYYNLQNKNVVASQLPAGNIVTNRDSELIQPAQYAGIKLRVIKKPPQQTYIDAVFSNRNNSQYNSPKPTNSPSSASKLRTKKNARYTIINEVMNAKNDLRVINF